MLLCAQGSNKCLICQDFFLADFFFSFSHLALHLSMLFTLGRISVSVGSGMLQGEGAAQPGWNAACLPMHGLAVKTH